MLYDVTTTLELTWEQCGEKTKLSFTDEDGINVNESLSKIFSFLESVYGYSVENHARDFLGPHPDEDGKE